MNSIIQSHFEKVYSNKTTYVQLDEVVPDTDFKANPERWEVFPSERLTIQGLIGQGAYRNIKVNGHASFRMVCNRSGAELPVGTSVSWREASGTVVSGTTSTITCLVGSFVDGEDVWNELFMLDDAGGAGAAPETEFGLITKAVASGANIVFTVQTGEIDGLFTVAPAVGDTFLIRSMSQVLPCNAAAPSEKYAGVVVRADGIPDNYWGWIAEEADSVAALIEAATAITKDRALRVAGTADGATVALSRLEPAAGGSLASGQCVGFSLYNSSADIVSDLIPVRLKPYGVDET